VRDVRDRLNNLNPFRRSSSIDSGSDMQQFASNPAVQQTLQAFNRSGLDGDKVDPKVVVALASAANEKGLNLNYAALSQNGEMAFGIQGRSQDDPAAKMVNIDVRAAQEQPLDTGLQRLAQQNPGAQLAANQDLEQSQRKGPAMA
jgi:hypothetical protein